MKIDLYNNYEVFKKESKQNSGIDAWCKSVGIDRIKVEKHPKLEDIRILIDLRNYSTWFNSKDNQVFKHTWHKVYENEYPLSVYDKRKLEQVVSSIEYNMKKGVMMMSKKGSPLAKFN